MTTTIPLTLSLVAFPLPFPFPFPSPLSDAELDYVKHEGQAQWNFRFSAALRSFGTSTVPTLIRIELFGERFFLDTFIGTHPHPCRPSRCSCS